MKRALIGAWTCVPIASFGLRTCRFWRPQGRDNSQGGRQKHRILLCHERQLGSRQSGMWGPKVSSPEGPYYASARIPACPRTHTAIYIRSCRWTKSEMRCSVPTFRRIRTRVRCIYRSNCAAELVCFPVCSNERAPQRYPLIIIPSIPLLFSDSR